MRLIPAAATVVLLITASSAAAQTAPPASPELGVGVTGYGLRRPDAAPSLHLRVNFSSRVAGEAIVSLVSRTKLFYRLQARIAPTRVVQRFTGFFTLGMLGDVRTPAGFGAGAGARIDALPRLAVDLGGQLWVSNGFFLMIDTAVLFSIGPRR